MKTIFTLTVFEIFLFEGRSVLSTAQGAKGLSNHSLKRCANEMTLVYPITLSLTEVRIIFKPGLFDFYIGLLLKRSGSEGGMTYSRIGKKNCKFFFLCGHKSPPIGENAVN